MSDPVLTPAMTAEIDQWLVKYPADQRQSAVLAALHVVQDEYGWISEAAMDQVAAYLKIPEITVYEVATFYDMYDLKPLGKHKIYVCTNISCLLCGSETIIEHLEKTLQISVGETTADGRFTLKEVECLAACTGAPMMIVNQTYHRDLTPEKVDTILASLEKD